MIHLTLDFSNLVSALEEAKREKLPKALFKAAETAGRVLSAAYTAELLKHHKEEQRTGTFRSARKAIEHFQHAFMSVTSVSRVFQDYSGAYSVVGIEAAKGKWQPVAPQAWWIEKGTVFRHHKSGHPTGKVYRTGPPTNPPLATALASSEAAALKAAEDTLIRELSNVLA